MSAIIEPAGASWWGSDRWGEKGRITFTANTEDRSVVIRRQYPGQDLQESIELDLGQLAEVEAMLLNARLWLERATKQAGELKAAEEVAEDGPQALTCTICAHPAARPTSNTRFTSGGLVRWRFNPTGDPDVRG